MADRDLRLRVLFDQADRLSKPLRSIAGGSRTAALALKGTREELHRINDAQGQLGAFTTLRAGMRQSAAAVREAEQRVAALGREIAQTAKPTRALQRDFAQATRTAEQLADSHRHDAAQLRELRTALQAAGANTRDLTRYETDLARRAAETTRVMEDQSRTLERASNREQRLRKPVQINSPSRVFTRYGGYLMEGLGDGIDRGAGGPLERIARVSRELTGAMALGAATPALATGAGTPGLAGNAGGGGFATMSVTIHINGADRAPGEIGREVEDALERIEARRRAASYSQFADRPDWNV